MHPSISLTHSSNPFGTYKPSAATTKRRVTKCLCPHSLSSQVDLSADPPVAPAAPVAPAPAPAAPTSVSEAADDLMKLKELLDAGILTQEEFDAKKKQLLGL